MNSGAIPYGFQGRQPTAEEKRYMDKVARIGCIVCLLFHKSYRPPEIHHTTGKTKPGAHFKVLPLCFDHHGPTQETKLMTPRHPNKARFEQRYMPEIVLLGAVKELVAINYDGQLCNPREFVFTAIQQSRRIRKPRLSKIYREASRNEN